MARAKMQPAVDKAAAQKPDNAWGQIIYDTLFHEVKPIISQVPAGWLKTVRSIEIGRVGNSVCNMTFNFAASQPWPYVFPISGLADKNSSYGDAINLRDNIVWGEFHAEVEAYHHRVREATRRRNEFIEAVVKICNTYSTLAPALKAWPPLWELIPEDVKDKHREIKERIKNEVVLDVDINKLTAMSTAAKFGI
jgi:hypothetical protein